MKYPNQKDVMSEIIPHRHIRYFIKADNLSVYEYYTGINVPRVWSLVRGGFGR
ncbi:hypothetical protein J6590_025468 [Homalodisca vitripennis]|nr:hypothetical protein J6590_025468 [Homalodisca vitripennis]